MSFRISGHSEQQGLDWIFSNAAFRRIFFRADHAGRLQVLRALLWGSEFKDTTVDIGIAASGRGPMRISPVQGSSEHTGSIGIRDAIRISLPQSCALA